MLELSLEFSRLTVPAVLDLAFAVYRSRRFPRVAVVSSVCFFRTLATTIMVLGCLLGASSSVKAATFIVQAGDDLQAALNAANLWRRGRAASRGYVHCAWLGGTLLAERQRSMYRNRCGLHYDPDLSFVGAAAGGNAD